MLVEISVAVRNWIIPEHFLINSVTSVIFAGPLKEQLAFTFSAVVSRESRLLPGFFDIEQELIEQLGMESYLPPS